MTDQSSSPGGGMPPYKCEPTELQDVCLKFFWKKAFRSEHALSHKIAHRKVVQWRIFPLMIHIIDKLLDALLSWIAQLDIGSPRLGRSTHND